jgi:hypothetical protein
MAQNRTDITVADLGELVTVLVAPLRDGTLAWVTAENGYFYLAKNGGGLVPGADVVAPIVGAPIAGAVGALWGRLAGGGGGGGGGITVGSFQRLPATQNTSSTVPSLFWSAPFTLAADGDVLFEMVWNDFMAGDGNAGTFMGAFFTADVDGSALPDTSGHEFNATAAINTEVINGTYQAVATGLTAGAHVLNIFWASNSAGCANQVAAGEANLKISRL